nr:MAG TPA: hypothetical protein [Caudoviricetes sp.]
MKLVPLLFVLLVVPKPMRAFRALPAEDKVGILVILSMYLNKAAD